MNEKKFLMLFSMIYLPLSLALLLFSIGNFSRIFSAPSIILIFTAGVLNFLIGILSVYRVFSNIDRGRYHRSMEKNVKDVYRYRNYVNPPELDN